MRITYGRGCLDTVAEAVDIRYCAIRVESCEVIVVANGINIVEVCRNEGDGYDINLGAVVALA